LGSTGPVCTDIDAGGKFLKFIPNATAMLIKSGKGFTAATVTLNSDNHCCFYESAFKEKKQLVLKVNSLNKMRMYSYKRKCNNY